MSRPYRSGTVAPAACDNVRGMRPTRRPRPRRRALGPAAAVGLAVIVAGCTPDASSTNGSTGSLQPPRWSTSPPGATPATAGAAPTVGAGGSQKPTAPGQCTAAATALPMRDRIGQLLMVGMQPGAAPKGLDATLATYRVGSVIYLGGWSGRTQVAATSTHLQAQVAGKTRLLIAADQEGGQVQQLKGSGFTTIPSAVTQAGLSSDQLTRQAATTARELLAAGVNVNLAPVGDVVPAGTEKTNGPIGRYSRHYGSDPQVVADRIVTVLSGLQDHGVVATVKHFPGIGRIAGNTDTTATGISDTALRPDDPYLAPFAAAIDAQVGMVMVSSARYPNLDASAQAVFSRAIVTGLLREKLGFTGVVITDDVGAAKALSATPVGDRAVKFIDAGGDIVLTATPSQVSVMVAALTARAGADPAFAAKIDAAAARVLELKARFGLATCS